MIEMIQSAPLLSLLFVAIGLGAGLLVGHFVLPSAQRARRLQEEVDNLRAAHDRYQQRVTEHFQTTAVLIGDLTSSYKAVYEHLAAGARNLGDPALSGPGFGAPRLIVDSAEEAPSAPAEPVAPEEPPSRTPSGVTHE
jgi:uncharacterized membrane-anchored protein YhcB (DUF1043 family)